MKISVQAKEFKLTILDDHGQVALDYSVDNYKLDVDMVNMTNGIMALAIHLKNAIDLASK